MLTLPLLLFSGGYAYAATTVTTYSVTQAQPLDPNTAVVYKLQCLSPGDYSAAYPALNSPAKFDNLFIYQFLPLNGAGNFAANGQTVNGWSVVVKNANSFATAGVSAIIFCTTPITVAGIGVPEFGSLYSAIALAAVLYFGLTVLRQRRTPAIPTPK